MVRSGVIEVTQEQNERWFERGLLLAAREGMEVWCEVARAQATDKLPTALNALGSLYLELDLIHEASGLFEEALSLASFEREVDEVRAMCNLSLCHYLLGESSESVAYAEGAKARLEQLGVVDEALMGHVNLLLGLSYIAAGCWEKALRANLQARDVFERRGDAAQVAGILNNLGLIHVETGRFDEAERLLLRSLSVYHELGDVMSTGYTLTELGRLYFKKGDPAAALRFGSRALGIIWENTGLMDMAEVARLCELFGSVAYATGDRKGAVDYLRRATTYYAQRGLWRQWAEATKELDQILHSGPRESESTRAAIDWRDKQRLRHLTTLLGLMDTLESLYPTRRRKAELVTKYSLILGEQLGLGPGRLKELSQAARLHDIGLTSMASEGEPGEGDHDERPLLGELVLRSFGVSDRVQHAVRHQREHFDGSGGPDGLVGEEIPVDSRVIAVAEAYVQRVLASDDPKKSHTAALAYVCSGSSRKFDPAIVDTLVRLHDV